MIHLPSRCSSEFIKSFGIGCLERGMRSFAAAQALERKLSKAWARKMPALTRPKNVVSVSIIANFLRAPARQNDRICRTVKRIPCPHRESNQTGDLVQQFCPARAEKRPESPYFRSSAGRHATIDSPLQGSPHFRRVRDAISSYLGAEVGRIGAWYRRAP